MTGRSQKVLRGLALLAAVFAFGVVMFGAFVRLSNAGLSCPDWPTCYGRAAWPEQQHEIAQNPLQRRARLADLAVAVGKGGHARVRHLEEPVAADLWERLRR